MGTWLPRSQLPNRRMIVTRIEPGPVQVGTVGVGGAIQKAEEQPGLYFYGGAAGEVVQRPLSGEVIRRVA